MQCNSIQFIAQLNPHNGRCANKLDSGPSDFEVSLSFSEQIKYYSVIYTLELKLWNSHLCSHEWNQEDD